MCEPVHCLNETAYPFSPYATNFSWFHHSNAAISSHNIRHSLFFFLEKINEKYSSHIPKSSSMTLPGDETVFALFRADSHPFSPLFWLFFFISSVKRWTHVSFMVMNQCRNSVFFLLHISKHLIEISSRCCFWTRVSKRGAFLPHIFLVSKLSVNGRFRSVFEMPTIQPAYVFYFHDHSITFCGSLHYFLEWSPHFFDHCNFRLGSLYSRV